MRRCSRIPYACLTLVVALGACGTPEPAPVEDQAAAEARIRQEQEQEAARRAEAAKALADRRASVSSSMGELTSPAAQLPTALEEAAASLSSKLAEVQALESQLAGASGEAWNAARDKLDQALGEVESAANAASASLADWKAREQAAIEARASDGTPIDPATGLLKGLDGGDYEPYKVSVVERVQERLRTLGLYAGPVDGVFDVPLRAAVGSFQEQEELPASGIPSPMTRSRLFSE